MTSWGASFKKTRESKGISISKIAEVTRISTRFLEAIENEDFHLLPGGIFNRGFIKAYAEYLGLDSDAVLSQYEQLIKTQEPEHPVTQVQTPVKNKGNFYPVVLGALVLAIIVFYVATRDSGNVIPTSQPKSVVSEQATSTPQTPSESPTSPTLSESPTPQTPSASPTPQTPSGSPVPQTPPASTARAPEPGPISNNTVALEIEAHEKTWIKVVADGNNLGPGELLEPGMTRRFTAQSSLTLTIGNAAGLTMKLNDQIMKPLGKSGQVREIIITRDNLKDFLG